MHPLSGQSCLMVRLPKVIKKNYIPRIKNEFKKYYNMKIKKMRKKLFMVKLPILTTPSQSDSIWLLVGWLLVGVGDWASNETMGNKTVFKETTESDLCGMACMAYGEATSLTPPLFPILWLLNAMRISFLHRRPRRCNLHYPHSCPHSHLLNSLMPAEKWVPGGQLKAWGDSGSKNHRTKMVVESPLAFLSS